MPIHIGFDHFKVGVVYDYKTQWVLDEGISPVGPYDTNGYFKLTKNIFTSVWDKNIPVRLHAELIIPDDAETLMTFKRDILEGSPAVLRKNYGKGAAYYIGFNPGLDFLSDFIPETLEKSGVLPLSEITGDDFIRVTKREGDGEEYFFVMNISGTIEQKVSLKGEFTDMLTGEKVSGDITLKGKGFTILSK